MTEDHPEVIGTLLALGALAFILIRQLMVWRVNPARTHFPWIAITACGIVFTITRVIHLWPHGSPETAMWMIRIQFAISMFLPGLAFATVEAIGELPISRTTKAWLAGALPVQFLCLFTPLLIREPLTLHHDLLGHGHYGAHTGPMVALAAPLAFWMLFTMRRRVRALPVMFASQRRNFRIGVVVFVAFGLHDSLMGAGVFSSVFVDEYAFVIFGIVSANFEARHTVALLAELEGLVERKREIVDAQSLTLDQTHRRLERSRVRYQQLADATQEGVVLCNGSLLLDSNRASCEMFALSEGEMLGADIRSLIAEPDRRALDRLLLADPGPVEVTLRRPGTTELVASIRAMPAPAGSSGTRVLLIRNVSGERELQTRLAVSDRLAAIGTLAAGTAHEINNPLTFVSANAEMLIEELELHGHTLDPELVALWREMLADVRSGAERVRRVVQDLSTLSRARQGEEGAVELGPTIERCIAMANNQVRHRARVVKRFAATQHVFADEGRLFQVFLNLIINAAHAIPEGHVATNSITISTADHGEQIVIEVSDTGSGMEPAVLSRIFTPFFTTKEVGRGTGLGLSISHSIITSLGGTIDVTSEVGRGTTFRVTLPAAPAGSLVRAASPIVVERSARLRVLVVDDELKLANSIARMLGEHQVDIVHSGRAALEKIAKSAYDVVLCDLMMHDVTGMELHARLVAAGHDLVERFIFMTGGAFSPQAQAFLDAIGNDRWVAKPIPMAELRQLVNDVGSGGLARSVIARHGRPAN